jgi:hypothetical protein
MGLVAASLVGAFLGCTGPTGINAAGGGNGTGGNGSGNGSTSSSSGSTSSGSGISGLPCDVANLVGSKCASCHSGSSPSMGIALDSYANVKANAAAALAAMQGGTMPPGSPLTTADIQPFADWVAAGTPEGTCGGVDAGPPDPAFQGNPTCASGQTTPYVPDPEASPIDPANMNPGMACVACHGGEPAFNIAGTVFATGKVTDLCLPPTTTDLSQAQVIITDANGTEHTLKVNSVGNFHSGFSPIATPYTAKVVYQGKTRAMVASQTSGDCNACHTAGGTSGAPGRVAIPQ